jgi:TPP-dependent 2-oxoacid decarboxylase
MAIGFLDLCDLLLSKGVVSSEYSARVTSGYAYRWSQGEVFDLSKSAVQIHRARLRKIGFDIARPFNGEINVLSVPSST